MNLRERSEAFRRLAVGVERVDEEVYRHFGRDPLEPVVGCGEAKARIALFGRDPGRDEVQHQIPFIGAGGQKVRGVLHQHLYGSEMADFDASVEVGRYLFWANTVPYKPLGNKAWSMAVKRRFQPLVADLLVSEWQGQEVITLGREAFLWFGINQSREVRLGLDSFWAQTDRFEQTIEVELAGLDGVCRTLRLHPLPHPSPLNATWYRRFPDLLRERLVFLELNLNSWSE